MSVRGTTRLIMLLLIVTILLAAVPAQAVPTTIKWTGDYFSFVARGTRLCVRLMPFQPGTPVRFTLVTVPLPPFTDRVLSFGPVQTNAIGEACLRADVAPGVYGVNIQVGATRFFTGPVITVFTNYPNFQGVAASGTFLQPNGNTVVFGLLDRQNPAGGFQFLFGELNPQFTSLKIEVEASSFQFREITATTAFYRGVAQYSQNGSGSKYGHYELLIDNSIPGGPYLTLELTDFTGAVVYSVGPRMFSKGKLIIAP